jgi:lipopolysaccharide transport system ATP-binding protein
MRNSCALVVESACKQYRHYSDEKPFTFHEAVVGGWRNLEPIQTTWALSDVSLTLQRGQMLGIVGKNGAGKSTLHLLLGGIIKPDSGVVRVNGRVTALYDPTACFHSEMTGRENARMAGIVAGLTRMEVEGKMDSIIDFAELRSVIDRPIRTYSSGMRMRLGFSVVVHAEPDVLLIDECLAVGDASFRKKCGDRIEELKARGCAVVLISHEPEQIRDNCDQALWLDNGRVMAYGDTSKVLDAYLTQVWSETSSGVAQSIAEHEPVRDSLT